jgi:indole-3-glycerol phosphate synthase
MATGSLRVNRDIIVANKRHHLRERQHNSPRDAVLAMAEMTANPPHLLNTIVDLHSKKQQGITLIGQINRTAIYDPVSTALHLRHLGVNAVSFFTDHAIYKYDYEDLVLVTRGLRQVPVLFQNYVFNEYGIMAARASGAAAIMLYGALLEPEEMRQLVSLAQRWRMVVICQVSDPDYFHFVTTLSPHVIAYGDPVQGDMQRDLHVLQNEKIVAPSYTQFMLAHPMQSIKQVEQTIALNVDALIVTHELMNDARKHSHIMGLLR